MKSKFFDPGKATLLLIIAISFLPLVILNVNLIIELDANSEFYTSDILNVFESFSGYYAALIFFWNFILGIRYIVRFFTVDYLWSLNIHKKLGIYGTLIVFIHPFLIIYNRSLDFMRSLPLPFTGSEFATRIFYGQMAFILFLVIYISSAILRSRIKFRPWLYIHYLNYLILLFLFLHAYNIGTYLKSYSYLKLYWNFLFILFIIASIYRVLKLLNWRSNVYIIDNIENITKDIDIFTLKPAKRQLQIENGQYVYIKRKRLSEAHPFSVMEINSDNLKFGILSVGKYSKELKNSKVGDKLYLDGPYGVFTKEAQNKANKVIISGGIGITPFIELVKDYPENTYLFNCNYTLEHAIYRKMLKGKLNDRYFDFVSEKRTETNTQEDHIYNRLLTKEDIKTLIPTDVFNNANFFICGSPKFVAAMESNLKDIKIDKSRIFTEGFGV